MAVTTISTNNKLIKFTQEIAREFVRENLFSPYMGEDLNSIIRVRQGNLPRDRVREAERAPAILAGHRRWTTGCDSIDEVGQLELERFLIDDLDITAVDRRRTAGTRQQLPALHFLGRIVDREIGRRLEEADPAHAVTADAAGGQVRDAAVGEPQPRIGDVG